MKVLEAVPELGPDEVDALPEARPWQHVMWAASGAAVVAAGIAVIGGGYWHFEEREASPGALAIAAATFLLPWLLGLPVMRRVDIRPVLWFYLCLLGPFFAGMLAYRLTDRLLSLPYRSWPVQYWHVHRVRRLPQQSSYVLVDPEQADPLPPVQRWEYVSEPVLRVAWCLLMPASLVAYIWRSRLPDWYMLATVAAVVATCLIPVLLDLGTNVLRRRRGATS